MIVVKAAKKTKQCEKTIIYTKQTNRNETDLHRPTNTRTKLVCSKYVK